MRAVRNSTLFNFSKHLLAYSLLHMSALLGTSSLSPFVSSESEVGSAIRFWLGGPYTLHWNEFDVSPSLDSSQSLDDSYDSVVSISFVFKGMEYFLGCPLTFLEIFLLHTVDTEFSVTNFFCLHFSEHAQWGFPVMSDILVKIFVDISCNICGLFLL